MIVKITAFLVKIRSITKRVLKNRVMNNIYGACLKRNPPASFFILKPISEACRHVLEKNINFKNFVPFKIPISFYEYL